jgi:hypothetical protein
MLDNYITTQENVIDTKLAKIEELERAIALLKKEIRLDEQLKQARVTASNELAQWLAKGKELLGDMAGIFPMEFLEDIKSEISNITEGIKKDYESYSDNGDRFLNASGEGITDNEDTEPINPLTPDNSESEITPEDNSEIIEVKAITSEDNSHNLEDTEPNKIVEITETITPEDNKEIETALSASELAKRLGFKSHHEVTKAFKNFTQSGFISWSINHDPDKYGWYKVDGKYKIVA